MSDGDTSVEKPLFTEKEQKLLNHAWLCLKSGMPEIDIKRLTVVAGFNTEKTCSNAWGVIKKKLLTNAAENGVSPEKTDGTPTTGGKKRAKKAGDDGADEATTPTQKRVRKTPAKKKGKKDDSADESEFKKDTSEGEVGETAIVESIE